MDETTAIDEYAENIEDMIHDMGHNLPEDDDRYAKIRELTNNLYDELQILQQA